MTRGTPMNIPASIHARLASAAGKADRTFSEFLQLYANERFLYRLSRTPHGRKFVLKGSLPFSIELGDSTRPTKDIDLLGRTANDIESLVAIVRDVFSEECEEDGMSFDPDSVHAETIIEDAVYEGIRVTFRGNLGKAGASMQVDISFADKLLSPAVLCDYPTMLDLPSPRILVYPLESTIAEKFEAMVKLGEINSRFKDFYDILLLSRRLDFEGAKLAGAIRLTFATRGTSIQALPVCLSSEFSGDAGRQSQWGAFIGRNRVSGAPGDFKEVVAGIAAFLGPVAGALSRDEVFEDRWRHPGPWVS